MGKAIRFLGRYSAQYALVFVLFAAVVVAGCRITGTTDGLFGTYAQVFFNFTIMFSSLTGFSLDSYMNIALSMGARRSRCFWAAQLCSAVNVAVMVLLAAWVRGATASLPCEEPWSPMDARIWPLLMVTGLFGSQLGLLTMRIEHPRWRTVGLLIVMLLCSAGAIALMVVCMLDSLAMPGWLLNGMLAGFPIGTVVAGAVVYRLYRKAVVRV